MACVATQIAHEEDFSEAPVFTLDAEKFRRRTVLLVDDDTDVLALLGETMTALGHRVITAQDGAGALKCLLKYRSIDCLFADVVMPNGMSGIQLTVAARAVRPGLPALLASAYPREIVSMLGEIPPGVGFIAKPYMLDDLFGLLDTQPAPRGRGALREVGAGHS